jgi:hypothetical protein
VSIQFSATQAVRAQVRRFAAEQAKTRIREMGLKPAAVKREWIARVERMRSIVGLPVNSNGGRHSDAVDAVCIFRMPAPGQTSGTTRSDAGELRIDEVGDLLLPSPSGETPVTRRAELRAALARFERGGQLITRVARGRVNNLAWLTRGPGKAHFGPEFSDYELGDKVMLVHDAVNGTDADGFYSDVMKYARRLNPKHELLVAGRRTDPMVQRLSSMGAETVATIAPQSRSESQGEQQGLAEGAVEEPSS